MRARKPRSRWDERADVCLQEGASYLCPRRRDPMDVLGSFAFERANELLPGLGTMHGPLLEHRRAYRWGFSAANPYLVAAQVLSERGPGATLQLLP